MILFVLEGEEREIAILKTIEELFFENKRDRIIYSFGTDIYELYRLIVDGDKDNDELYFKDVVSVLQQLEKDNPNSPINKIKDRSDVSEVYLFFDYDLQISKPGQVVDKQELNSKIEQLVSFFCDETDHGKLFVNYPMVESLRYFKSLPDPDYYKYDFPVDHLTEFKESASLFSCYGNLDFSCFRVGRRSKEITVNSICRREELSGNWRLLTVQNVEKANFICCQKNEMPTSRESITQSNVFNGQMSYYYPKGNISVLNSFPLFIYDYFGRVV
jgi:hypothetical protein